jgi:hypothetical protein
VLKEGSRVDGEKAVAIGDGELGSVVDEIFGQKRGRGRPARDSFRYDELVVDCPCPEEAVEIERAFVFFQGK